MRTGRPIPALILSREEHETLERWARPTQDGAVFGARARIILLCGTGKTNCAVAEKVHLTKQCVGKWRSRFVSKRLDGLLDEWRLGAPRIVSDTKIERVIQLTLESTPSQATHWSIRSMAKHCGLSRMSCISQYVI